MNEIAFFDFDGTLTTRDTLIDFTRYAFGDVRYLLKIIALTPFFALWACRMISRDKMACLFIRFFYQKKNFKELDQIAALYARDRIKNILRPDTYQRFCKHIERHHEVAVVSASPSIWLKQWCDHHKVKLIATQLEVKDSIIQGTIVGSRCNGEVKVARIQQEYDLSAYDKIYAYGNSKGDLAMLGLADEAYYNGLRMKPEGNVQS